MEHFSVFMQLTSGVTIGNLLYNRLTVRKCIFPFFFKWSGEVEVHGTDASAVRVPKIRGPGQLPTGQGGSRCTAALPFQRSTLIG